MEGDIDHELVDSAGCLFGITYSDAKNTWDSLISVYEQRSIQRLCVLMTEFFKHQHDPELDTVAYVAKIGEAILGHEYRAVLMRVARHTDWTAARADPGNSGTRVSRV